MRAVRLAVSALLCLALALSFSSASARVPSGRRAAAPPSLDDARRVDVNNLNLFVTNFGSFAFDLSAGNAGLYYPRGSANTIVFAAGLWMGATVGGETRVTAAEYSQEFGPGVIGSDGGWGSASNPAYRTYKVARFSGDPQDTAHVDRSPADLAADPAADPLVHHSWSEYMAGAVPDGAPWKTWRFADPDHPGDSLDVPGPDLRGDRMLWSVFNDANPALHTNEAGNTGPLDVQVEQRAYAFNRTGALGNTIFLEYRIVHPKLLTVPPGSAFGDTLKDAYVSLWLDPDLGGYLDDLAGCDTTRSLGYFYNATNNDAVYGSTPPALGVVILRGPKPRGSAAALGMTSFQRYINGTDPTTPQQSYNYMRGLTAAGAAMINPVTGTATSFAYSGDPVAQTGWLDLHASDRRMQLSSGPFDMAPGDTQVIVAAIVIGQGSDRLASITGLRFFADQVRAFYEDNLTPVLLSLASAVARADRVELTWSTGSPGLAATLERNAGEGWSALSRLVADGRGRLRYEDRDVSAGRRYGYRLHLDGASAPAGETWIETPRELRLALDGLTPNPASRGAFVSFTLPENAPATLELIDVSGRRVLAREVGSLGAGRHVLRLDGDRPLPAGLYFMRLRQCGADVTARGVIVR